MLFGIPSGGNYGDTNTCQPYFLPECKHHGAKGPDEMPECGEPQKAPDCVNECFGDYPVPLREDVSIGGLAYILLGEEEEIMGEIQELGPVAATFSLYEDFYTYSEGIYQHVTGEYVGGATVKLIGWGIENVKNII